MVLGPLISAGANILGGIFGSSSASKQQARQMDLQVDMAKKGIQWRVQDAKKAGIHPLAALGAQTMQFSPVGISGNDFGAGVAAAGQDIGRAIDSTRSGTQRVEAVQKTMNDLTIQRMGLENELLAQQIARVRQPGSGPAMPSAPNRYLIDGQGESLRGPLVSDQMMSRTVADPANKFQEPGAVVDIGHARTRDGGLAPVYSVDVKQRLEDDPIGMLNWNWRNRLTQGWGDQIPSGPYKAPPGQHWEYDLLGGQWVLRPNERR